MKQLRNILLLIIILLLLSSCSRKVPQNAYDKLIISLESMGYKVDAEDVDEHIFQGVRKWLTVNDSENISVYLYESNLKMERDASYISADGFGYDNGVQSTITDWVSYPHFYKSDNIIVLYVGDNSEIIDELKEIVGPQFAGEIYAYSGEDPITMQHGFPVPLGINPNPSEEQIEGVLEYWTYSEDWALTMPAKSGDGSILSLGIGQSDSIEAQIPYRFIDKDIVQAEDLAAINFAAVQTWYFEGLSIVTLTGFRGDKPNEPGYSVIQYISTIQSDVKTARGITIGDSVKRLKDAYPEVKKIEDYWSESNEEWGIPNHDSCYVYATAGTNRSIIFLTQQEKIVQIDIADGLDGPYWNPSGPGFRR